jgi:hypothetical protein
VLEPHACIAVPMTTKNARPTKRRIAAIIVDLSPGRPTIRQPSLAGGSVASFTVEPAAKRKIGEIARG